MKILVLSATKCDCYFMDKHVLPTQLPASQSSASPASATAPSLPDGPSVKWVPRWVLVGYGLALGLAGATLMTDPYWNLPWRAVGFGSVVLGAGCVLRAGGRNHGG
jgi:hypothetical protein